MTTPDKQLAVKKQTNSIPPQVNQGRHEAQCSICKHAQREEIDRAFLDWESPDTIADTFGVGRASIYRHANALALYEPRDRNIKRVLGRIIEHGSTVDVTAAVVVSAISTLSKLNASGQWIDRRETIDLNDMFARMTEDEMRRYASNGELPAWFTSVVGETDAKSQRGGNAG